MPFDFGEDFQLPTEKKVGTATWGDVGRKLGADSVDLVTQVASAGQYAAEQSGNFPNAARFMRGLSRIGASASDSLREDITEGGKRAAEAEFIPGPGRQSVFDAPGSSAWMKLAGALPSLGAIGGAAALSGGVGAAGVGTALQMGQVIDQTQRLINSMDDGELTEKIPAYAKLRSDGMDEEAARTALAGLMVTNTDLLGAAAAGALGAIPMGRALTGAARGILNSGVNAAVGMALGAGQADYARQSGGVAAGMQDEIDYVEVARTTANAAAEGGVLGGVMGVAQRQRAAPGTKSPPPLEPRGKVEKVAAKAPDAATTQALTGKTTPVFDVDVQLAPKRGKRARAKEATAPEAPPEAPKPPVTETGNDAPPSGEVPKVEDAGLTVPEKPATFKEQIAQLIAGDRAAVLFPKGSKGRPPIPEGMKAVYTPEGSFYYDPKRLKAKDIYAAIAEDRLNEILELGPVSKTEAIAREAQGEAPIAVTERTPDGTEVKAAGTEETAPRQVEALEGTKTEGNTVQVEPVEQVLADRVAPESAPPTGYTTAKGSTYVVHEDGTTTRDKAARPEHPGDSGMKPRSARTVYVDPERVGGLAPPQGDWRMVDNGDGTLSMVWRASPDRPWGTNPDSRNIPVETTPREGLIPVELWRKEMIQGLDGYGNAHFGNPITEVRRTPRAEEPTLPKPPVTPPVTPSEAPTPAAKVAAVKEKAKAAKEPKEPKLTEAQKAQAEAEENYASLTDEQRTQVEQRVAAFRESSAKLGLTGAKLDAAVERQRRVETEALLPKDEGEPAGARKSGPRTGEAKSSKDLKRNQVRRDTNKSADEVVDGFKPGEDEKALGSGGGKGMIAMAALQRRLTAMLQAAEAAGVKLPERLKTNADPTLTPSPGVALLVEARDLLRAAKKRGGVSNDHIADFTRTEWDLRQDGEAARDRVLEKRREEGDLRKKQTTDAAETAAPKDKADAELTGESGFGRLEDAPEVESNLTGKARQEGDSADEMGVHQVVGKAEDIGVTTTPDAEVTGEGNAPVVREREKVQLKGDEVTAGKDATGSGVQSVTKGRFEVDPETGKRVFRRARKASLLDDVTDPVTGETAAPRQTLSAREMLDRLKLDDAKGISGALARAIRNAFMRVIPEDLQVHILDDADFDRLVGSKTATAAYIEGPWSDSMIAVRASRAGDGERMRHVILHEATHAVMQRALEQSPDLQKVLTRIAGAAEDWLSKNGTDAQRAAFEYALRRGDDGRINLQEFLAETFGKAEVQEVLSGIPANPLVLGLLKYGKERPQSLFDAVKGMIRRALEALGLPKQAVSLMEASLTVGDDLIRRSGAKVDPESSPRDARISFLDDKGKPTVKSAAEAMARQATDTGINLTSLRKKVINKVRSLDNMARAADRIFGGADNNPIRKIQETVETIRVAAQKNLEASEPVIKKMDQLQRKHTASGQWALFTELQHDANMLNVHPDVDLKHERNKHVSEGIRDVQSRLGHAELAERFAKLDPELQGLWREATDYFAKQQNAMAQKLLTNHLMKALVKKGAGDRDAIAQRFFDGKETEADIKLIGQHAYDALKNVNELRRLKGPYFPQMRRGDFVVTAEVTITPPKDGKKLDDGAYAFDQSNLAVDFAREVWKKHGLKATVRAEYYNPETGKTYFVDTDGTQVRASKLEPDAAKRFVVDVPNRYVSFHETMAEAQRHAADMAEQGYKSANAAPRRFEQTGRSMDMLSSQMRALMARVEGGRAYKDLTDAEKEAFKQALDVMSLQMLGSTRVQSRRMPRNFIQGASRDVTRNTLDYAQSMAAHLAKLDHQPTIDEALIRARELARDGTDNAGRTEILNEVEQRLAMPEYVASNTSPAMNRILQLSFLDKLFSPAYNLINMTQPIVNTVPLLAARHGWGATTAAMSRAYSIIGGGKNLAEGAANTLRAAKGKETTSVLTSMRDRLAKAGDQYVRLFDYLEGKGAIGGDAGLEVAKSIRRADGVMGKVDAGINYADAIARALPEAIEANNRMATAVAAFDLELKKGASEDAAMRKALDVVNQTQFNYSATNAPTFMKHPLAKVFFQFKKYAQGQYQFLGEQIATALKDADPAARKEAAKVLMNHALMVTAFAGAVGLPTEPIKVLLLAAAPVTGFTPQDFEREIEKLMPEVLSRGLSRGIPGGFAFDLSSRMGENSMLTFGTPKSYKSDDVKAWLFDNLKGAPAGLVEDWVTGVNGLLTGDSAKQVESVGKLIPIKMFSDTLDAYRKATEGKTNARGQQKMAPYSPQEAMVRAMGFTPAREANTRAAQSYFYDKSRELKDERSELTSAYLKGKTGDERTKAWARIVKWNASQAPEARITREQLTQLEKSDRKAEQSGRLVNGVRVTKQNERFLREGNQIYGVQ